VTQPGHSEIASSASYIQCTVSSNKQDAYRYISSAGVTYLCRRLYLWRHA